MKKIIALHGWTYSIDKYDEFNAVLKKMGIQIIMLKVPGLTEELKEEKVLNINDYVEWLKEILYKEKDKLTLLGHSNGGRISLNFACQYPEKVDRLILIDSAGIYHNELYLRVKRLFFATLAKIGKKLTTSPTLKNFLYRLAGETDYENASKRMGKTMVNLMQSDAFLNLNKITTPTLIIWGENDKTLSLRDGEKMCEQIKNSTLKIIKGARHSPQFTNPQEVANLITDFLKN